MGGTPSDPCDFRIFHGKLGDPLRPQVQGVMFQNMIPEPKKKATRGAGQQGHGAGWFSDFWEWDGESAKCSSSISGLWNNE